MEKQYELYFFNMYVGACVCVFSLNYTACRAHAPYYSRLWPSCPYETFPYCLVKDRMFERNLLNTTCVCCLSVQLSSERFLTIRTERDTIINVRGSSRGYLLFLLDFNEACIFATEFRKIIKYHI